MDTYEKTSGHSVQISVRPDGHGKFWVVTTLKHPAPEPKEEIFNGPHSTVEEASRIAVALHEGNLALGCKPLAGTS